MAKHQQRTGLGFERVMVFPQGRFAKAALSALRANNYLAAVNTSCFPTDQEGDPLVLADLLAPAVTKFHGFPVFPRRYARRLVDVAFDLFLGRPALLVEHHEYFRDGCRAFEQFAANLRKLEPALSWPTLTEQLERSCLTRKLSNGSLEIKFYTRRFLLTTRERSPTRFLLSKHEPNPAAIQGVQIDGTSTPFFFENGFLKFELQADDPRQRLNIAILDREQNQVQPVNFGIAHNTRVLMRRSLSEFRDNALARHGGLLSFAKGVAKTLKLTGDT
jgi:hypothetical protein